SLKAGSKNESRTQASACPPPSLALGVQIAVTSAMPSYGKPYGVENGTACCLTVSVPVRGVAPLTSSIENTMRLNQPDGVTSAEPGPLAAITIRMPMAAVHRSTAFVHRRSHRMREEV